MLEGVRPSDPKPHRNSVTSLSFRVNLPWNRDARFSIKALLNVAELDIIRLQIYDGDQGSHWRG